VSAPTNDGGPAFPREENAYHTGSHGMTLRDWFAGQALAGILINYTTAKFGIGEDICAKHAYEFADAMIAAREQKEHLK
jgi:hypothetical protein